MYRRSARSGFGKPAKEAPARSKPLKRPTQARGKFTVQAIYDAFVRIWNEMGWDGVTTRKVALESGVAVGTLYDYFPDKDALLSGYVRHCVEALLGRLDVDVIAPIDLPWRERLARLVRITCDSEAQGLPTFDRGMLMLEHRVAEPKHHRRVYDELASRWESAFAACVDLKSPPSPSAVRAMFTAAWGARRYRLLLEGPPELTGDAWLKEIEAMVLARVATCVGPLDNDSAK